MTRLRLVMEAMSGDRIAKHHAVDGESTVAGRGDDAGRLPPSPTTWHRKPRRWPPTGCFRAAGVVTDIFAAAAHHAHRVHVRRPAAEERVLQRAEPADAPRGAAVGGERRAVCTHHAGAVAARARCCELFVSQGHEELRLSLARRELAEMLVEGHEAGILRPVQRTLAQTMLAVAGQPVGRFAAPAGRVARATTTMTKSEILRIAQGRRRTLLPMEDPQDDAGWSVT